MIEDVLQGEDNLLLPSRPPKPREDGWTVLIDNGVPLRYFQDMIESGHKYVDLVKFGWGTSIVSDHIGAKIDWLRTHGIDYFFGGTLFEKFFIQGKVDAYKRYCHQYGCRYVELSNGTIDLSNQAKAELVHEFARDFLVLSEVGYKDQQKSINLSPVRWIEFMRQDLEAGATKVITEARESGTGGICRTNGEVRYGLIEEILDSGIEHSRIIFEAPNKTLQTYFIEKAGSQVNLANVAFTDVIGVETLRLGLRSDTFMLFENS
ncbi:phosphosulfolactate synthase [Alicyclobacillus sp. ALC3]|uniref:phosphosulfolactate synthase n=1 Tax=Alicyclobacillus sp. ALC3 TaxID=2796143 RepID=UPI0023788B3E|nr:phosphosulfolactate synthase [Alicyclobacillus sp. ALC3]WDL96051.1 phosphosulfolactate synthase [Alicyclobacillus sp. ALC3]